MRLHSLTGHVRAVGLTCLCLVVFVVGVRVGQRTGDLKTSASPAPSRDVEMYSAIVHRLRSGETYHAAVGTELRQRHYPTIPVFNWRTPLLYSALARVPERAGRAALVALSLTLLAGSLIVLSGRTVPAVIVGLLLQIGAAVSFVVPEAAVMSEAWAGALVGLSMCAYRRNASRTGASLALLALFVRELVAPYAVVCALLALWTRRKGEYLIWILGALAYAAYYGWHFVTVSALHQTGDFAHQYSWFYGGGLPFLLNTMRMNAFLLVLPPWVSAAVLALLVTACASPLTDVRLRWTIAVYLAFFVVVGQPFNYYWGLIPVALWPLAVADGVSTLSDAMRQAVRGPGSNVPTHTMR